MIPTHNMSAADRRTFAAILEMATYLTGKPCAVHATRSKLSPGLTRYTVKVPRTATPLAVAPGARTLTAGLDKLVDVLTTKTLRKLHTGIRLVGAARKMARSSYFFGAGSPHVREEVARAARQHLPGLPE